MITQVGAAANQAAGQETRPVVNEPQMVTKDAFLRLLVAQIKNQNPLNPADGIEFLTQLAQFTELEQMLEIRKQLEVLARQLAPQPEAAGT
ncbi:MAG TPA: flagellar hook capping FlgD N-terminal domain-containing protein [Bryobacteraceae bacterium]|nr:flagellar hook capping FlgD N-terminal domain-containing protein [Bryobacteraceae bacterium]